MNMPGFTAEASLFNGDIHYQATTAATVYSGFVQPALFRLRFDEIYTGGIFLAEPDCFKTQCIFLPSGDVCFKIPGFYNFFTHMCE